MNSRESVRQSADSVWVAPHLEKLEIGKTQAGPTKSNNENKTHFVS